jgi:mannose-6-phosphate isomerase-like protein (cupin superfamily)
MPFYDAQATQEVRMPQSLAQNFIHLGPGATAISQPDFNGGEWYEGYGARHDGDGADGRLVSQFTFTAPWDSWEMHPEGEEVVLCIAGMMQLHQEFADGTTASASLGPGQYAINPRGCWHTADIDGSATAVFITAGLGTRTRPR